MAQLAEQTACLIACSTMSSSVQHREVGPLRTESERECPARLTPKQSCHLAARKSARSGPAQSWRLRSSGRQWQLSPTSLTVFTLTGGCGIMENSIAKIIGHTIALSRFTTDCMHTNTLTAGQKCCWQRFVRLQAAKADNQCWLCTFVQPASSAISYRYCISRLVDFTTHYPCTAVRCASFANKPNLNGGEWTANAQPDVRAQRGCQSKQPLQLHTQLIKLKFALPMA